MLRKILISLLWRKKTYNIYAAIDGKENLEYIIIMYMRECFIIFAYLKQITDISFIIINKMN